MPPTMTGPPPTPPQRSRAPESKESKLHLEVEHFLASLFGHLCWLGARVFLAKLAAPLAVVTGSENQHSAHRSRGAKGQGFRLRGLHKFRRWNKEKGGQPT